MYFKYLISGSLIIAVSAVAAIYSLITGLEVVLGASLTTLVLGIVVLTTGLTYGEPLTELYRTYVRDLSRLVSKVLEDSGLLGGSRFRVCLNDFKAVISTKPVSCLETSLGFGLVNDTPYLALPLDSIPRFEVVGSDLRGYLSEVLTRKFRVCRGVNVLGGEGGYTIELLGVGGDVLELIKTPPNYIKLLVLGMSAKFLGSDLELVSEDLISNNYVVKFRVVK